MDAKDTSTLYFNVQLSNPITATSAIPASIKTDLTNNIVGCAADFDGSIVRLSLPLSALPYFDASQQTYKVTLVVFDSGSDFKFQTTITPTSFDGSTSQVYFINQFLGDVNAALAASYTTLTGSRTTLYQFFPGHAPFIQWNSQTNLFTLVTDVGAWETGAPNNPRLFFNTPLMNMFQNLPNKFITYNSFGGMDNQLNIVNRGWNVTGSSFGIFTPCALLNAAITLNSTYTTFTVKAYGTNPSNVPAGLPIGTPLLLTNQQSVGIGGQPGTVILPFASPVLSQVWTLGSTTMNIQTWIAVLGASVGNHVACFTPNQIQTTEEAPSCVSWWNTNRIVVTTGILPARPEGLPTSVGTIGTQNILTDFVVSPTERLSGNTSLLMIPQPQYRWFDFISEEPIKSIDLQYWAADFAGNLTPILLEPGQAANSKLLFDRKGSDSLHLSTEERREKCYGASGGLLQKRQRLL